MLEKMTVKWDSQLVLTDFEETCDSVGGEVFFMELIRLIEVCCNESGVKVCVRKHHLSDAFSIQNGLCCFITIALEYDIRKAQEYEEGGEMNITELIGAC
jgi:hypothetical protein